MRLSSVVNSGSESPLDVVCNHLLIALEVTSVVCLQALTGQEAQGSTLSRLCRPTHSLGAAALLPQPVASLAPASAKTRRAAAAALMTAAPPASDRPVVILKTATTMAWAHIIRTHIMVRSDLPPCANVR